MSQKSFHLCGHPDGCHKHVASRVEGKNRFVGWRVFTGLTFKMMITLPRTTAVARMCGHSVERRLVHESTKARALAMWAALHITVRDTLEDGYNIRVPLCSLPLLCMEFWVKDC